MHGRGLGILLTVSAALVGCDKTAPAAIDAGADASSDGGSVDAAVDAALDAAIDAPVIEVPDTDPPHILGVTPTGDAWLHEPVRFELDEKIVATSLTVTATVAGSPVSATASIVTGALDPDGHAIVVAIDPAARGVGALAITVTGSVTDLAGNVLTEALTTELSLAAWNVPPVDRGVAADSPSIAIAATGEVTAAWLVGVPGSRLVAVSRHERGAWVSLGTLRGTADASSASVALDALNRPVVAWIQGGQAQTERWDGNAWEWLASPGAGTTVALAAAPAADPVIAVVGSVVSVKKLVTDTWVQVGGDLAIAGTPVGEPALAATVGDRIAIAWVEDSGGSLRATAHRFATSWTAMTPLALGSATSRISIAARGPTVAIAWERWDRSYGVYAAIASGDATTTWTALGRPLDVDQPGDAVAPAIGLDVSGAPIVAWEELIEGTQRGAIARWDGSAWRVVGGRTWMTTESQPTRTMLALHEGQAPVVGWSTGGVVHIAHLNGPALGGPGMSARTSIAGCTVNPNTPPARVMLTGCFTLASAGKPVPHAGLVPYDVNAELWTDGTKKRRWIALPDGAAMTSAANGSWVGPAGTMMVKEFAIETTPGDSSTRKVVETRFWINDPTNGWMGITYRWRQDGLDADVLSDQAVTVAWPLANGGSYSHYYPSRTQCRSCHHSSFGPILGLRPEQLTRMFDYNGIIAEQLPTLSQLGIAPSTAGTPLPSPHDPRETPTNRVRSYMAANCAHCHNASYISIKDTRFTTPLAQTRLCEVIIPGDPVNSRLHQLVTTRPGMPALGTLIVDPLSADLISTWITQMTSCP
ncbi:MAG: hypothetical protein H0T42_16180 [Deltaproteobacteria bacterium]|nr:hypothetical protein [Deltaproteobacteria bacterium]